MNSKIKQFVRSLLALSLVAMLLLAMPFEISAAEIGGYTGASAAGLKIEWSRTTNNSSRGTGTAALSSTDSTVINVNTVGYSYWGSKSVTVTVTFTNTSSIEKALTFTVTRTAGSGGITASGATASGSTYTATLAAGGSCSVAMSSGNNATSTFTISGVSLKSNSTSAVNVTFAAAETNLQGVVTGSCNQTGKTVAYTGDITGLTVSPTTGYKFVGWQTSDGVVLGTNPAGFPKPDADITVKPCFAPTTAAEYNVNGDKYYYWEDAVQAALKASDKKIVITGDGTLPGTTAYNKTGTYAVANTNGTAVTYTLPTGCYLVIPHTATDTGTFASGSNFKNGDGQTTPSVFRTFTVASGAKIICASGSFINVNAIRRETGQGHVGQVQGKYGKMVLNGTGSQLEVNGTLYCYGYISGTGMVEVNGTIHELLEMGCWNGGSNALGWSGQAGEDTIFMVNQFFVQNVEAPLKINGGAKEYLESVVMVDPPLLDPQYERNSSPFIMAYGSSEGGLFQLPTGSYILREHDLAEDRVTYTLCSIDNTEKIVGLSSIVVKVKSPLGGEIELNSSSYTLDIPNNMSIKVGSNVTVNMGNRLALLPGANIEIAENAKVNLTNHLYIFGYDDWNGNLFYQATAGANYAEAAYYTTSRGTTRKLVINSSGMLKVDGILHVTGNGGVYTTGTADNTSNMDKVIYGKGTIIHEGTLNAGTLKGGFNDSLTTISVTNAVARLAGITDPADLTTYAEMGNSTYYGLGDAYNHFWYETKAEQAATCTQEGGTTYNVTGGSGLYIKTADKLPHSYDSQTNDATCTEDGSTVHTCSACGDTYTEVIVAFGHKYISVTVEATCTTDGVCTHTCSVCSDSYSEVIPAGHTYEGNSVICTVCKLFEFYASNVHLGNSLDMMFAFPASAFVTNANLEGYYVKVVRTYADGSTKESKIGASSWSSTEIDQVKYYVVIYKDFAAKDMCDSLSLTVCRKTSSEEEELSTVWTDSIQSYALRMLSKHSDNQKLCTLLVDMLNYGAACQTEFKYNTGNLANAGLSDEQQSWATSEIKWTDENSMPSGSEIYEANLIVDSNIRFVISGTNDSLPYTFDNHWDVTRGGDLLYDEEGKYYYISKLFVADARQVITITAGDTIWTDSVEAYCYRMYENGKDTNGVFTAFMKFSNSAYEYLHDEEARV